MIYQTIILDGETFFDAICRAGIFVTEHWWMGYRGYYVMRQGIDY